MSARILCAALALAAPLASAQNPGRDSPTAVYQTFADRVTGFIAENGCTARNPATGRVLPPLWLRFAFHDADGKGRGILCNSVRARG
ncbi:hypothetical protein BDK51DRAFT_45435 [Blyttiomyces helicus]|uniref:Uncharacterized protein n=1 Tax=Blyttiomyces helicus TaxID=388810 RepID=A0A4P9WGK8_9FUNG|nr:hypothetical protein BDK51DRAFT_45435 [Blyttiomyces helicus]|eukprot:RKO90170.1 hypothetical protein BDK51DRAFT_45435 [Blyttiomyces helicus]